MNKQPKIIYSLDTYPLINNRWNMGNKLKETIYMTALSVLQSHLWYPEIELYVDETAYRFLYMLPCKVTCISYTPDADLWMKIKMEAIGYQKAPFVHLDTDVFLSKNIDFSCDEVLLERQEASYKKHYKPQLAFFNTYAGHFNFWHEDLQRTYSCGVLGFNNLSLRDYYLKSYAQVESVYKRYRAQYSRFKQMGFEPCIVIEQYTLACLLNYLEVTPNLVLQGKNIYEHAKEAKSLGFSHLFGVKKYQEQIITSIEERLQKIFPFWFQQIKNEIERYEHANNFEHLKLII